MQNSPVTTPRQGLRVLATRMGHEVVWIFIAGLFCIVEGVILVTDMAPYILRHNRKNDADHPGDNLRPETAPTKA